MKRTYVTRVFKLFISVLIKYKTLRVYINAHKSKKYFRHSYVIKKKKKKVLLFLSNADFVSFYKSYNSEFFIFIFFFYKYFMKTIFLPREHSLIYVFVYI